MSNFADLPKLVMALEYADMAAAHYLVGGSDQSARLLAAGAEALLGDLAKMLEPYQEDDEIQAIVMRTALTYEAPSAIPRGHPRLEQDTVSRAGELAGLPDGDVRAATAAYLRSAWFLLESMGLEALIPSRLQRAVDESTISVF